MYAGNRGFQVVVNAHSFLTRIPEQRSRDTAFAWYATCICGDEVNLRLPWQGQKKTRLEA
jgi:hypothetical protein